MRALTWVKNSSFASIPLFDLKISPHCSNWTGKNLFRWQTSLASRKGGLASVSWWPARTSQVLLT
jgi:hypothetical protein